MNILLDKLPKEYNGLIINTDFRVGILFELLMQDRELNDREKTLIAYQLFFDNKEGNLEKAINEDGAECMLWFYRCGKEEKKSTQATTNNKRGKQIYSYEFDSDYIFSAFLQQYGINLNSVKYLHWWEFKALFEGLTDETQFVKIMGYRSVDLGKIKDKEEKKRYQQLQKLYALPDMRTEQEKEADFGKAFW